VSKNTGPVLRFITDFRRLSVRCVAGLQAEAVSSRAPSPCLTLAFLLSLPLWGVIWAIVFVVTSAWLS
jgi:hypothetical protein